MNTDEALQLDHKTDEQWDGATNFKKVVAQLLPASIDYHPFFDSAIARVLLAPL